MPIFKLVEAEEYYDALLQEIPRAKKRITVVTMVMLWGERTAPLFELLETAVRRGVKVTLVLDNYTRLTYLQGLQRGTSGAERLRRTFRALEGLSAAGAHVVAVGKIGFPPQKGRCHVKATVIDTVSYGFGGVNFMDENFKAVDYMLKSRDPEVADSLDQLVGKIMHNQPPLADAEVKLGGRTTLLFDGGRRGSSIIYERACELSAQARRIRYASQMVPSGQLARLLNENGAQVYATRAEQLGSVAGLAQAYDQQKFRIRNLYRGTGFIHAKVMLFELPGGRKALLSGSHNFSYRGVAFGTQELALESRDPALWKQLDNFIQRRVTAG